MHSDDPAARAQQEAQCPDYALEHGITETNVHADSGRYRTELATLLYAATEGEFSTALAASITHLGPPQRAITQMIGKFESVGVTAQSAREFDLKNVDPVEADRLYRAIMDLPGPDTD